MGGPVATLPLVAQAETLEHVFLRVSRFSEMRSSLQLFDRQLALTHAAKHFGAFGAELLALNYAAALVHPVGIKCVAHYGPEMYVVRIPERRRWLVSSLIIEELVFANGVFSTVLVAVLETSILSNTGGVSRLRVCKDRKGNTTFYCAFGRNRYRVDKLGGVYKSSVTPKNSGFTLRAPQLTELNQQNHGRNHNLCYFPGGIYDSPYSVFVKHGQSRMEVSSLLVYAHHTGVVEDSRVSTDSYSKIDRLSGARVPERVYHDQCLNAAGCVRFYVWGQESDLLWSTSWRLCGVARLGDLLFLKYAQGDDKREGIVRIPELCSRIVEVIPYDGRHVMILCNYLTAAVPLHPDGNALESRGMQVSAAWQSVTIIAPVTPVNAFDILQSVKAEWLEEDAVRGWGARYVPDRREYRHGELQKIEAPMHPRLVLPGHFKGRLANGGRAITVFGDALLAADSLI